MTDRISFKVSTDHVNPAYRLKDATLVVRETGGLRGYYVNARPFGCSKDYATPEAAVRGLLADNGCKNIRLQQVPELKQQNSYSL